MQRPGKVKGGSLAVRDALTGVMSTLDASGATTSTFPLAIGVPAQLRFGLWVGTATSTPSGTTSVAAQVTAPLNAVSVSYGTSQGTAGASAGNSTGQSALKKGFFDTREDAAVAALDHLEPVTEWTRSEWGALIGEKPYGFTWSRFVTSHRPDTVTTPLDMCNVNETFAARLHTHPKPMGQDSPSGDDLKNVDAVRGIPFYFLTPAPNPTGGAPIRMQKLKTWNTGDRTGQRNLCVQRARGVWEPYPGVAGTVGARCDTPIP